MRIITASTSQAARRIHGVLDHGKWGEWHLTPDENSVSWESWGCRCCLGITLLIAHLESRTSCRVKLSWWGAGQTCPGWGRRLSIEEDSSSQSSVRTRSAELQTTQGPGGSRFRGKPGGCGFGQAHQGGRTPHRATSHNVTLRAWDWAEGLGL